MKLCTGCKYFVLSPRLKGEQDRIAYGGCTHAKSLYQKPPAEVLVGTRFDGPGLSYSYATTMRGPHGDCGREGALFEPIEENVMLNPSNLPPGVTDRMIEDQIADPTEYEAVVREIEQDADVLDLTPEEMKQVWKAGLKATDYGARREADTQVELEAEKKVVGAITSPTFVRRQDDLPF